MIDPSPDDSGSRPPSWDGAAQQITTPARLTPEQREHNKSIATVWMIGGAVIALPCGVAMGVGQVLPVFILCAVGFFAGMAAIIHGRSIGNR